MTTASTINFGNVVGGSSALPGGVNSTYFYARFVGYLIPSATGVHTIGVNSQGGCNLYIGGQPVFTPNLTASQSANGTLAYTQSGTINLTAGVYYPIVLEWQHGSGANYECQLAWTVPLGSIALIPTGNLSDSSASNTGVLDGTWWNGTSGLWFPAGNGVIDFASTAHPNKQLDNIPDGTTYARVKSTAITGGSIDLSKAGVLAKGGTPPAISGSFSYTSTTTTITVSWPSSMAVYRADGSVTTIGAGSQTITGLTANTQYNFYPVYDELTATLRFISESDCSFPAFTGVLLNGTTGYTSTATAVSNPGSFSVEVWVDFSVSNAPLFDLSAPQVLGTTGNKCFSLYTSGAHEVVAQLDLTGGITSVVASATATLTNEPSHVVFTWDNVNNIATIYINGVQIQQSTEGTALATLTSMYWHIGGNGGKTGWAFTSNTFASAWLSNAAVYNGTILSAAQVASHYTAGTNLTEAAYDTAVIADGASYLWELNETSGTTAADSVGSNTGTYRGGVTLNQSEDLFTGVVGTPAIAFTANKFIAVQQQNLQNRIALSAGPLQITTPSSGTGGAVGVGGKVPPGGAGMN